MHREVPWLAAFAIFLAVSGFLYRSQQSAVASSNVTSVRQFDSPCAKCHSQIYQRYMTTPMANASGLATDAFIPGKYSNATSGVTYEVFERDGAVWLRYDRPGDKNLHGEQKLDYFMGSGAHALTYLYSINGYWFEMPIAYYHEKSGYDMRPSMQSEKEMLLNLPQNFECIHCHVNSAQVEDPGTRNHFSGTPFLHGGIACEDCHGDSSAHVASGGKDAILDIAKLDPDRQVDICLLCHLEGDAGVVHRGRSLKDFKPGENLANYVSYFVRSNADASNRGVTQVEGLYASTCKRVSGAKMSCITCHDPHSSPSPQERTAYFRSKCLSCHTDAKYATAHYSSQQDCTSCHMPKRQSPDLAHSIWTDHRILAQPESAAPASSPEKPSPQTTELIPVPGIPSSSTPRDVALAYYRVATDGDESAAERAWPLLQDVVKADPSDSDALAALGFLAYVHGDPRRAYGYLDSALSFDRNNFNVAIDVGTLLARGSELQRAADIWEGVFANNRDITELGMNLANAQCKLGQVKPAEDALRQVLIYSPDHRPAREQLDELESGKRTCPPVSNQK